jgi:hypothetical protein
MGKKYRRMKILAALSAMLVLACASHAAEPEKTATLELEGRYWIPTLKASARASGEVRGTDIDLKGDLGLGNKDFAGGKLTWYTGNASRLFFDMSATRFSGDKNIQEDIEFNDQTYTIGSDVSSELKFQIYRLGWIWEFLHSKGGRFKAGTLVSARAIHISLSLDSRLNDQFQSSSENFTVPVPSLGFALDWDPNPHTNLYFYSSGLPSLVYGYFIEGEAGIKIMPVNLVALTAGYRYEDFNANNASDNAEARLRFIGPFVGVAARF